MGVVGGLMRKSFGIVFGVLPTGFTTAATTSFKIHRISLAGKPNG